MRISLARTVPQMVSERAPLLALVAAGTVVVQLAAFVASDAAPPSPVPVRWLPLQFSDAACDAARVLERDPSAPDEPWRYHASDEARRIHCVSAPFTIGDEPYLVVQYAGDPTDPHVALGLDFDGDGGLDRALGLEDAARHGWNLVTVELPASARGRRASLVIADESTKRFGWLAVRHLGQTSLPVFPSRRFGVRTSAAAALLTVSLFAVAWAVGTWSTLRAAAPVAVLALMVEFLSFHAFYTWDEYSMLAAYAAGLDPRHLVAANGHFSPILLGLHAVASRAVRDKYSVLQIANLLMHAAVVLLLARWLVTHGFRRAFAVGAALIFGAAWVHAEVVPWFLTIAYTLAAVFTLLALQASTRIAAGRPHGLLGAAVASALAGSTFTIGLLAPWLCVLYLVLFALRRRRAIALLAIEGLALVLLAWVATRGNAGRGADAMHAASLSSAVAFWLRGTLEGSLAAYLGLPGGNAGLYGAAAALALGVVVTWYSRVLAPEAPRAVLFGMGWLGAAYAMQAPLRSGLGSAQALSFRYTYFGLLGVTVLVCAALSAVLALARAFGVHRGLVAALVLAALALAGRDVARFRQRVDNHEREYFALNYQQYAAARALGIGPATSADDALPARPVVRSLHPFLDLTTYGRVVAFLAGGRPPIPAVAPSAPSKEESGWLVVLGEPQGR